ncbi:S-layer homology domain-containing protein [Paenibacillus sp. 1_12]|uniref:S-layer homology domain-containing protein n=1 Tax=Paenibacillus sp. 1_12 TaxID=1566278 RepID=UPI0008E012FB|nr:S-layer homology domain-containing protein [Paenibacillus sp. 1_12]SFK90904.1 S-layer homology domain-containing protein [Paenibacillus sp. 1_12]
MNNKYNYLSIKKMSAGLMALSVMMCSPVYAADPVNTPATTTNSTINSPANSASTITQFADVSPQHWAIKHITKLAALGIVQGYEKAEFRPDNSVSQQDAIIMALRLMGLENEVLKIKTDTVLGGIVVDSYAKPYIAYALDKGLINFKEETDSLGTNKTAWGSRPATREWVAKIVIRSIGKDTLAQQQAASTLAFADAKDFSSWAVGYVNAAVSLKIVNGMDDNKFQPAGNVTRAQMATFLSRADKELTQRSERVVIGYVMSMKDNKLTIQNDKGQNSEYTMNVGTVIYNAKDDSRIPSTMLKETNQVYIIQTLGVASYVELINDQERMESFEGTLDKLYLSQMTVSINQSGGPVLKELAPTVTVTDKEGHGLSIGSIQVGSLIELKRSMLLPNAKISQIVVKQVPLSKSAEGTVVSIQKEQNSITFLEQTSGQNETYPISTRSTVTLPDGTVSDLSKLRIGDIVGFEVKTNEVTSVTIRKQADVTTAVTGTLTSLSQDKKILTINKPGSTLGAYFIADNALVTIDGLPNAGFFDLEVGDDLKLDLLNEKIVKVTVTSRSINVMTLATIVSYDPDAKLLTVTNDSGKPYAFILTDNTGLKIWDAVLPLSNFASQFTKGKKVDLKVSKDKLLTIELTTMVEGTITQLSTTSSEVTLRTNGGQNINFKTNPGIGVEMYGKPNALFADLRVGDTIQGRFNGNQDLISSIAVKKTAVYKVILSNAGSKQISVKDDNGVLNTFTVDNNDKIFNPTKATHNFEDIQNDEYIKVSLNGNTLEKLIILNTLRGKVTALDTATGTLTVQELATGAVQVVPVGLQFVIKQNGIALAALNALKPNDRVEIIKDAGDKVLITVANTSKRTVASYDNVLNQLLLKPNAAGDKSTYNFFAKAYLHKGTTAVAANAFVENEEITLYAIDDKIIEIEKQ